MRLTRPSLQRADQAAVAILLSFFGILASNGDAVPAISSDNHSGFGGNQDQWLFFSLPFSFSGPLAVSTVAVFLFGAPWVYRLNSMTSIAAEGFHGNGFLKRACAMGSKKRAKLSSRHESSTKCK